MKAKIVRTYNDQSHFGDSSRDSFYEALVNETVHVRFVRCDDKHSRHLGDVEILEVNGNIMTPLHTLKDLGLDEDQVVEALIQACEDL